MSQLEGPLTFNQSTETIQATYRLGEAGLDQGLDLNHKTERRDLPPGEVSNINISLPEGSWTTLNLDSGAFLMAATSESVMTLTF